MDLAIDRKGLVLLALLAGAILANASIVRATPPAWSLYTRPMLAPAAPVLRLATLADSRLASRAASLYIQAFDAQAGAGVAIRDLEAAPVLDWLRVSAELDPDSEYPLLLATRVYAEAMAPQDSRLMLEWVRTRVEAYPQHWKWLAHALHVARHRLHDMALASSYAATLARVAPSDSPVWARQAHALLLADMDELEGAATLIGALLEGGSIADPGEREFLARRLHDLRARSAPTPEPGGKH